MLGPLSSNAFQRETCGLERPPHRLAEAIIRQQSAKSSFSYANRTLDRCASHPVSPDDELL